MFAKIWEMMFGAMGLVIVPVFFLLPVGALYWIWLAIKFGSFTMFVFGVLGPTVLITAPIGLYSLIFGVPNWLMRLVT